LLYYPVRSKNLIFKLALVSVLMATGGALVAQTPPALVWITNSSIKLQQLIGEKGTNYGAASFATDTDRQTGSNLLNRTYGLYQVGGTDLGCSFEYDGRVNFLFGDTLYLNAGDTMAWSTSTNPWTGLLLNFFTNSRSPNLALTITPTNVDMGPFNVPAAGVSNNGNFYIVCKAGHTTATGNTNDYSLLVRFDETNQTFSPGRTISSLTNGGHFIDMALCHSDTNILMFGLGNYRASAVYLATVPATNWESGAGTLYFTGLTNGVPAWSGVETNAVPLVTDNPTNPTIGNVSVNYSPAAGLWLMTYDGGRQKADTTGVYFAYAPAPWGPWSPPALIFNDKRDQGLGAFIYTINTSYHDLNLAGPTIGGNVPTNTPGGIYAPYMIERYTQVVSNTLTIYYTLATWNPYTIVLMTSDFTVVPQIDPGTLVLKKNKFSFTWSAPTNGSYQVDYSSNLLAGWTTFSNIISSSNGTFDFTNTETGGLPAIRFYRLRSSP
jgi:Domain of unknown function (DUF4185)